MWQQHYSFAGGSLWFSALVAAVPLLVLFYLLGVRRTPGWMAALSALAVTLAITVLFVGMPPHQAIAATLYGAAFGIFPISWIVFASILLYRIAVDTGTFEVIKNSIGTLSDDRRIQLLLIAFCFSAFIEGSAGFGSPVAVAAAMLAGLGFPPFYAAVLCLLGNTAPVAFGSIGIPIVTLAGPAVTGLPMDQLSAMTGRILSIVAVLIPVYMLVLMSGVRNTVAVWPALIASGVVFGLVQFLVSNFIGPYLTDILAAIASMLAMVVLIRFWQPANTFRLEGDEAVVAVHHPYPAATVFRAWLPYQLLVVFVLVWGYVPVQTWLDSTSHLFQVPGLHNMVERMPPVVAQASQYPAVFRFNWLSAAGSACVLAAVLAAMLLGVKPTRLGAIYVATLRQLALPISTIALVLALAYLMNYSGMTSTLGLAFSATGPAFPFFGALLGWLGVVLTGSVTSSNALFGNLQVVTANQLGLNPILTAATNASGGVMGKMVSLQSIAVAVAATGMPASDESRLFRVMLRHSLVLVSFIGLMALVYAYLLPHLIPHS